MDNNIYESLNNEFSKIMDTRNIYEIENMLDVFTCIETNIESVSKKKESYGSQEVIDAILNLTNVRYPNCRSDSESNDIYVVGFCKYHAILYLYGYSEDPELNSFDFIDYNDKETKEKVLPSVTFANPDNYDAIIYRVKNGTIVDKAEIQPISKDFKDLNGKILEYLNMKVSELENETEPFIGTTLVDANEDNMESGSNTVETTKQQNAPNQPFPFQKVTDVIMEFAKEKGIPIPSYYTDALKEKEKKEEVKKVEPLEFKDNCLNIINDEKLKEIRNSVVKHVIAGMISDFERLSDTCRDFIDLKEEDYTVFNYLECRTEDILIMSNIDNKIFGLRIYKEYDKKGRSCYKARTVKNIEKCLDNIPDPNFKNGVLGLLRNRYSFYIQHECFGAGFSQNPESERSLVFNNVSQKDYFQFQLMNLSIVLLETYRKTYSSYSKRNLEAKMDYLTICRGEKVVYKLQNHCLDSVTKLADIIEKSNILDGIDDKNLLEFSNLIERSIQDHQYFKDQIMEPGEVGEFIYPILYTKLPFTKNLSSFSYGADGRYYITDEGDYKETAVSGSSIYSRSHISFCMRGSISPNELCIDRKIKYNGEEFLTNLYKAIRYICYSR